MTLAEPPGREIRSYVLRQGRLSQAQKRALEEDLPQLLFSRDHCSSPQAAFDCLQPLTLEIGFGNGESLLEMAKQSPERNFIGFEITEKHAKMAQDRADKILKEPTLF